MVSGSSSKQGLGEHLLNKLTPVRLMVKLKVIVAAKIGVEVFAGDELEKIRVEAHLVAGDGVEEGRDAFVEE
jgi:hypothetical protein